MNCTACRVRLALPGQKICRECRRVELEGERIADDLEADVYTRPSQRAATSGRSTSRDPAFDTQQEAAADRDAIDELAEAWGEMAKGS